MDEFEAIRGARGGDRDAFGVLVRLYRRRLYYYVVGKVAAEDEAEDIVQKSFVTAFTEFEKFDPGRPLIGWLRGIALNHCRKSWRNHERSARLQGRLLEVRRAELELGRPDADDERDEDRVFALEHCLEGLSAPEQAALRLRFVEEAPLQSIGEFLGKNVEAARQFLFRLRVRLLECVKRRLAGREGRP